MEKTPKTNLIKNENENENENEIGNKLENKSTTTKVSPVVVVSKNKPTWNDIIAQNKNRK